MTEISFKKPMWTFKYNFRYFCDNKIASIRCWKMSGSKVVNCMVCTCFDVNFANSFLGEDGPGECTVCNSHVLVEKLKCKKLYLKANVLKSLKIIYTIWRSFFPVWYSTSGLDFLQLPWMPRKWLPGSLWWSQSSSWAQGQHPTYKLVSTFLQDGDVMQPRYPERQMICNKTWCLPFGAENPIWRKAEKEHQISCAAVWGFGFFSALSCTFF